MGFTLEVQAKLEELLQLMVVRRRDAEHRVVRVRGDRARRGQERAEGGEGEELHAWVLTVGEGEEPPQRAAIVRTYISAADRCQ